MCASYSIHRRFSFVPVGVVVELVVVVIAPFAPLAVVVVVVVVVEIVVVVVVVVVVEVVVVAMVAMVVVAAMVVAMSVAMSSTDLPRHRHLSLVAPHTPMLVPLLWNMSPHVEHEPASK